VKEAFSIAYVLLFCVDYLIFLWKLTQNMGNNSGKTRKFILVITTEKSMSNKKARLTHVKTLHSCMEIAKVVISSILATNLILSRA